MGFSLGGQGGPENWLAFANQLKDWLSGNGSGQPPYVAYATNNAVPGASTPQAAPMVGPGPGVQQATQPSQPQRPNLSFGSLFGLGNLGDRAKWSNRYDPEAANQFRSQIEQWAQGQGQQPGRPSGNALADLRQQAGGGNDLRSRLGIGF